MNRMSWEQFWQTILRNELYEEFARREPITARMRGKEVLVDLHLDRLSPAAKEGIQRIEPIGQRDLIDIWLRAKRVKNGPKVFRPSLEQCLVMEQIEPRVPVGEYVQPY